MRGMENCQAGWGLGRGDARKSSSSLPKLSDKALLVADIADGDLKPWIWAAQLLTLCPIRRFNSEHSIKDPMANEGPKRKRNTC